MVSPSRQQCPAVQRMKPPRRSARASMSYKIAGGNYFAGGASAGLVWAAFLALLCFLAFLCGLALAGLPVSVLGGSSARTPKETRTNAASAAAIMRIIVVAPEGLPPGQPRGQLATRSASAMPGFLRRISPTPKKEAPAQKKRGSLLNRSPLGRRENYFFSAFSAFSCFSCFLCSFFSSFFSFFSDFSSFASALGDSTAGLATGLA